VTWREDLRRVRFAGRRLVGASFRGVPFFVDTSERTGGRRAVVHEFPLRDDPFSEDLGRHARKFRVDGYVLGDDYLAQRDALLSALEDVAGPGELVHPYYGTKRAICDTVSVREQRADGGIAQFAIDFVETPAQAPTPSVQPDTAGLVATSAAAAHAATRAELAAQFNPAGMPTRALASAQAALTKAAGALKSKLAPIVTDTQELSSLTGQLTQLTAQASSLVRQPAVIATNFLAAFTGLDNTISAAPATVMNALIEAYSVDLGAPVIPTTTTRQRELANQVALTGALRRTMAIEAARIAPSVPYTSIEDATAARDRVAALLDDQAQLAGDTAYPALVDLRCQLLRAVPGSAALASIVTITRRIAIPSLVLAYQLYGSVDQEADILARNRIQHPGFITGDIKVLSDG
jgi:prophage DNA circulation protein